MSEFLKSFSGQKPNGGRSNFQRPPLQANICVQITGHDLSAPNGGVVHGMVRSPDWMAGDEVSMRMTTMEESVATFRKDKTPAQNAKFEKTRPTIAKLMQGFKVGKNDIEPMQVGGLLMFHGCTKDMEATTEAGPTVWKSQYAENYGNDASRDVMHGFSRITVEADAERPRARMDILFPRDTVSIQSFDDLKSFYDTCMDGQMHGVEHNANAAIRLIAGDQVKSLWTYSARTKIEIPAVEGDEPRDAYEVSIAAPAAQTWKEAVEEGKQARGLVKVIAAALSGDMSKLSAEQAAQAQALKSELASGALKIEAIPGRRIPIIGTSLEDILNEGSNADRTAQKCLVSVDGTDKMIPGFVKMTVGVMVSPAKGGGVQPDTMIVTKFAADAFAKARTIDFVPSPNFTPAFTKAREAESEAAARQAADQGGVPESSYQEPVGGDEPEQAQKSASLSSDGPGM